MVKKTIISLVLYFFAEKRIFCQGAGAGRNRVFLAPWSRSRSKKIPGAGAGAAWEKNREPEPLKNLPAPQPWRKILILKVEHKLFIRQKSVIQKCDP